MYRQVLTLMACVLSLADVDAATFTVINTAASGAGSLKQAILDANAGPGADVIEFALPPGSGPIIGSLPIVSRPVTIDGTTQQPAGFVEVQHPSGAAFTVTGGGSTLRGLVVSQSHVGIRLEANGGNVITGCRIGTSADGLADRGNGIGVLILGTSSGNTIRGNLISGNINGLQIGSGGNVVIGNDIGPNLKGRPLDGRVGVLVGAGAGNRVGGAEPGEGNVFTGLAGEAISIRAGATGTLIQGNRIGTDRGGASGLGNAAGIVFADAAGTGNVVGGTAAGAGNLIVASRTSGIVLSGASGVAIRGNTIGTPALPNEENGIDLDHAEGNTVEGNAITGNALDGVLLRAGSNGNALRGNQIGGNGANGINLTGGERNRFAENAIDGNGSLGIELQPAGVSPNDPGDADLGHNQLMNHPVLVLEGTDRLAGTLGSAADAEFTIELFASPTCDPTGNGEGASFLAAISASTDATGAAAFTYTVPPAIVGQVVTATATDRDGNTSEFSACAATLPPTTTTTSTTESTTTTTTTTETTTTVVVTTSTGPSTTSTTAAPTTSTTLPPTSTTTTPATTTTTEDASTTTESTTTTDSTSDSTTTTTPAEPPLCTPESCDDRNACTTDACDAQVGCTHDLRTDASAAACPVDNAVEICREIVRNPAPSTTGPCARRLGQLAETLDAIQQETSRAASDPASPSCRRALATANALARRLKRQVAAVRRCLPPRERIDRLAEAVRALRAVVPGLRQGFCRSR